MTGRGKREWEFSTSGDSSLRHRQTKAKNIPRPGLLHKSLHPCLKYAESNYGGVRFNRSEELTTQAKNV